MAEVKQTTREYANTFKQHADVDIKAGRITLKDTAFNAALEQGGVSTEEYKKVTELNANIAAGLGLFTGEAGIDIFKKNKDIETVAAQLSTIGRDSFKASFERSGQFTNPKTKEKVVQHGILNVQHNVIGTKKGQYGAVKQLLKAQAGEAYGK